MSNFDIRMMILITSLISFCLSSVFFDSGGQCRVNLWAHSRRCWQTTFLGFNWSHTLILIDSLGLLIAIMMHIGVQIDMWPSQVNTSKLSLAHEFLKQLNVSLGQLCSRCEDQSINTAITVTLISLENNGDGGDTGRIFSNFLRFFGSC